MINFIDINKSQNIKLPYLPDNEYKNSFNGKGWSFSFVYHFSEIKDIYLAIKKFGFDNIKEFTKKCIQDLNINFVNTPWDLEGRRILEIVNALKNFKLIDNNYVITDDSIFSNSEIGAEITEEDQDVFKNIYFSYFRFKEIMGWFVDPIARDRENIINSIDQKLLKENSKVLYPFSRKSRFTDSFIYELKNNIPIYYISSEEKENGGILRFWDVFVAWGQELGLIEKFNLKNLDYQILNGNKSLSCVYFKREIEDSFNLFQYIMSNYRSKYINVPKLIFRIAVENRYAIEHIKSLLIKESIINSEKFSLQRTSEIFIRNTEINFVPIVNDSYISHILIQ